LLLKEALPYELGTKIADSGIRGVRLEREPKRSYPEGSLAAQLIGFMGKDDKGLTGLESDFDKEMAGKFGTILYEQDTAGDEIPLGLSEEHPAEEGSDLILTIDRRIQRVLERELDAAMVKSKPSAASMIVLDPRTGAILGMASQICTSRARRSRSWRWPPVLMPERCDHRTPSTAKVWSISTACQFTCGIGRPVAQRT